MNKLNSFHLKIIALAAMTTDHIAAYGMNIFPFISYDIFRGIGRIAMPLFMFVLVMGAKRTQRKAKFLLRLYLANIAVFILWAPLFLLFKGNFAPMPSVLSTYVYVLLYGFLIEKIITELKSKKPFFLIYTAILAAVTFLPRILLNYLRGPFVQTLTGGVSFSGDGIYYINTAETLLKTILPPLDSVDSSVYFVIMGVIWYFVQNKYVCSGVLVLFGIWGFLGANNDVFDVIGNTTGSYYQHRVFFDEFQSLMVFAALFMAFYNGERGKPMKRFFYIYYPLHIFIISAVNCLLGA